MTREEFKKIVFEASKNDKGSPKNCIHLLSLHAHIEKIYDDFEAQLKDKYEEIDRLKAEIENLNKEIEYYEQFSETIASAKG